MIFAIKPAVIEEKQVIFNLFQPYMDELSSFPGEEIDYKDEKGIYHYPYLDDYWRESVRHWMSFLLSLVKRLIIKMRKVSTTILTWMTTGVKV